MSKLRENIIASAAQIKRRIEIIGIAALEPGRHTLGDFANIFGVDEEMLKKDLNALRSEGIAIHKIRKKGVAILREVNPDLLGLYIHQYMLLCNSAARQDKLLSQLVKKKGAYAIGLFVVIDRSIRERTQLKFTYQGESGVEFLVSPLMLFRREGLWRLLGIHDGAMRQFHVAKILAITMSNNSFTRPSESEINAQFKYSWDTWIGTKHIPVKLKLSDFWAERLNARPAVDDQQIARRGKDDHLFEGSFNSLEELSRWIAGRGGEVVAIEPPSLRTKVVKYARASAKAHTT